MPLSVKDGMSAWIKDFQKSDAPQFKGKSEKERREMAVAAYMSAKKDQKAEGFVSDAQRKAVWANKADGGKGHPDNKTESTQYVMHHKMTGKRYVVGKEMIEKLELVGYSIIEEIKPPFTPDKKKTPSTVKDKSGAIHTPMSRARHLARLARDRAAKKEEVEENYNWKVSHAGKDVHVKAPHAGAAVKKAQKGFGNIDLTRAKVSNLGKVGTPVRESIELDEMFASTVDKHKDGYRAKVVKDANKMHYLGSHVYKSKEHARNAADHIANAYRKGRASDSYIQDFARRHHKEHGMKESFELDEAMTTAIEFPNYFDLSRAEQDKIVRMTKKYNVETPIEKRGRRNVIIADGPKSEMQKLERDLKRAGVKFVATESVEHIEEAITANTKYGRAHDNAMKLTDKAKKSRNIDHYVDAIKAHKEALKHAQSSTNKAAHSGHIRDLSKKLTMAEDVEYIEEANAYANAGRALADYARKQGGMDKADFNKASKFMYQIGKADILSKGQHLAAFSKFFRDLDTDVRDGIVQILKKQNVMESIEQLDELSPATHKSYQAKAFTSGAAGMAAKRMGKMSAKDAYDNEKKRHAGIELSKFLQRRDARKNRNEETELDEADNFEKNFQLGEEMMFKVSVEGLPDMVMIGNSPSQIKATLRKIVKQPSMIGDIDRMTKGEVKKRYRDMAQDRVEEAKSPNPEDEAPASPDEMSMAVKQAEFIQYVGKEIEQYLKNNKRFPEWMQNKLSAFHQKAKDVHSTMAGDYGDDE